MLPENNIPEEIIGIVCYSEDMDLLEIERDNYVLEEQDLFEVGGIRDIEENEVNEVNTNVKNQENDIPLQSLGVVNLNKDTFIQNKQEIQSSKVKNFAVANTEESQKKLISNPVIKSLKRHLSTIRAKVVGTDELRIKLWAHVWGFTIMKSPPTLWLTLNPLDTYNPIAQVLAGMEVNLDDFIASIGPNPTTRSQLIANDPYEAAQFFH
ncbi:hypothetical protein SERLA73DRAFT_149132 [Serpula lacrymans var. lacrymans S7.3]|uniref:Helitron helicase-like domain-containing protein n=2 Tax=Serpula lacrymans var. lacrymans TaxID=341189 RepID=F8PFG6_SERL3|nr:uncharacterized protein SERLADRAFT_404691 [Serpula lacrymans var. lacrymans S7.9]EGO04735.1 hypothetical protein SERLA73DRAFT_149132 [Serpula lacrymans var. lacrymans S7.3]EGO30584.1 hypothetical protein SERLADRAFT_404691 [Serpula lacrymans var. lacrymans S7.9]